MKDPTQSLTLQLLEWIGNQPRSYAQVLEAWRTTCPRLSIWEDACADGLIQWEATRQLVSVSAKGKRFLLNSAKEMNTP